MSWLSQADELLQLHTDWSCAVIVDDDADVAGVVERCCDARASWFRGSLCR